METEENPGQTLAEAAERLAGDFESLKSVLAERADALQGELRELVETHPVATLGGAFLVGYVLAGGLYSRTTGRLMRLGLRWAGAAFLRPLIVSTFFEPRTEPAGQAST